ncbi:MAG: hypothetical protein ACM31C_32965, partial [Acidobacteriota bacterium]
AREARGFPASALARTRAGDWRDLERVRAWSNELADELPSALPGTPVQPPARAWPRLLAHAAVGWAACALVMAVLLAVTPRAALAIHAVVAPLVFAAVANHYFAPPGAREPLPTALAFAAIVGALDLLLVGGVFDLAIARSVGGFWIPLAAIFVVTWAVGAIRALRPLPRAPAAV